MFLYLCLRIGSVQIFQNHYILEHLNYQEQFFLNHYLLKRDRSPGMASLCFSHQDTSIDMQHGLFWSSRGLNLR